MLALSRYLRVVTQFELSAPWSATARAALCYPEQSADKSVHSREVFNSNCTISLFATD